MISTIMIRPVLLLRKGRYGRSAAGGDDADGCLGCPASFFIFWHRFEDILKRIMNLGIEVDLILFHPYDCWGFFKDADGG